MLPACNWLVGPSLTKYTAETNKQTNKRTRSEISVLSVRDDKFVSRYDLNQAGIEIKTDFSEDEIDQMNDLIDDVIVAEKKNCDYNDFLFTTFNLDPPLDALDSQRNDTTKFIQTTTNSHPSCMPVIDCISYDK